MEQTAEPSSPKSAIAASESEALSPIRSDKSSSSIHSDSSTLIYGHEPFDQFGPHVKELCQSLWGTTKLSLIERLSRSHVGELLHTRRILSSFRFSTTDDFVTERLEGGGYNRIIGITVINKKLAMPKQMILRIPRFHDAQPGREVATVRYVRQHTSIPVADIVALDFTDKNPLKKPYVIQDRIPGTNLADAIPRMSQKQLCLMATELGRILVALQSVRNPTAGVIQETSSQGQNQQKFQVRPFELKTPFGIVLEENVDFPDKQSTLEFFISLLGRWKAADTHQGKHKDHLWDCLITAARQMDQVGFLPNDRYCLCHLDYHARNVMVDISSEGKFAITGVLDWDSAVFAPKFVSCAPPWWIWVDEDNEDDDDDESHANDPPESETGKELKRYFEESVGKDFLHYAYEPQYRLARMLFRLAIHGLRSSEYFHLADAFQAEWDALYASLVPKEDRIASPEPIHGTE